MSAEEPTYQELKERLAKAEGIIAAVRTGQVDAVVGEQAVLLLRVQELERALRESRERYRAIFEQAADSIVVVDAQTGALVEFNDKAHENLGYTREEFQAMTIADFELIESPEEVANHIARIIEEGCDSFETKHRTKGGEIRDVLVNSRAISIAGEVFTCSIWRDITERKRVEEALRESAQESAVRNRIAETFLTAPDDEVYAQVLQSVLEASQSKHGVFGYISENQELVCPSMTRDVWDRCKVPDKSFVFPRETWGGIWGRTLVEKKALYSNEPFQVPAGHIAMRRALCVPIIYQDEVIGILEVANKAKDYDEKDKDLVETIAGHISPILHARLQNERYQRQRRRAQGALRASEERYRAVFEQAADSIVVIDADTGAIVEFNDRTYENLGYSREEFQKLKIADFDVVESAEEVARHIDTIKNQGGDAFETKHRTKDGQIRAISVSSRMLAVPGRNLLTSIWRDVTERQRAEEALRQAHHELERRVAERTAELTEANKQLRREIAERNRAEAELRKSEERLSSAHRVARMGVWDWNIVTNDLYWSDEIYRIFDLSPQEFGATFDAFLASVHPDDRRSVQEHVHAAVHDSAEYTIDHRIVLPGGQLRHVHEEGEVARDANGAPLRMVGTVIDITERKLAETALRASRSFLQTVVDGIPDPLLVIDRDFRVVLANRTVREMAGGKDPVPASLTCYRVSHHRQTPCDGKEHPCPVRDATAAKAPVTVTHTHFDADGNERVIEVIAAPIFDGTGEVVEVIESCRDITERRRLEREILEIGRREQQRIGRDLHDVMGQQLTGMAFLAKVLENKLSERGLPEAASASQIAEMIKEAIVQARGLAKGLCPVELTAQGLMNALEEYAVHVEKLFGIGCAFRCDQPVLVHDDSVAAHLYHIAQEAVNNAVKHGQAQSIEIAMTASDTRPTLTIKDDGVGLPDEYYASAGMGLRTMNYRARMSGGTLDVRQGCDGGTVVTCSFQDAATRA